MKNAVKSRLCAPKYARRNYCHHLRVSQLNYPLTNFADHLKQSGYDAIHRYLRDERSCRV